MGYIRGFRDGFVLGVTIGVLTAPRAGKDTRDLIARTVTKTKGQAQGMADRAQQGWQVAHPALDRAAQASAVLVLAPFALLLTRRQTADGIIVGV